MIRYFLLFLKYNLVFSDVLEHVTECPARNISIDVNDTYVDLSDMETDEMDTKEQAAYAHRKFMETIKDGELGSWGQNLESNPHDVEANEGEEEEISERSFSSKSSSAMDVFWDMERKAMDLVPIDGPVMNDSQGNPLPPPPAHVRMNVDDDDEVSTVTNMGAGHDDAAEDYYDDTYKPQPITRKDPNDPSLKKTPQGHRNQTFFRGRARSKKGLTYWMNQQARKFELEGVSIKPSPRHWPDPTERTYNTSRSGGQYIRRPRGGRLRFSKKRNTST